MTGVESIETPLNLFHFTRIKKALEVERKRDGQRDKEKGTNHALHF